MHAYGVSGNTRESAGLKFGSRCQLGYKCNRTRGDELRRAVIHGPKSCRILLQQRQRRPCAILRCHLAPERCTCVVTGPEKSSRLRYEWVAKVPLKRWKVNLWKSAE